MDRPSEWAAPKEAAVIACAKRKRASPGRAIDLHDRSPFFRLSIAPARREENPVLILSAKYGLVRAGHRLEPYELDLRRIAGAERAAWQTEITREAQALIAGQHFHEVICFAAQDHRRVMQFVCGPLGVRVSTYPGWRRICDEAFGDARA